MKKQTLEKGRISPRQFTLLVMLSTIGDAVLIFPPPTTNYGKQDVWLSTLLGLAAGLLCILLYSKLAKSFPGLTLIEAIQKVFGKWIGTILSLSFLAYTIVVAVGCLREISDFVVAEMLGGTPMSALLSLYIIIVVMAIRLGIEVIGRTGEIFTPLVIFFLLVLTFSIVPQMQLQRLLPILEYGIKPVIKDAIPIASYTIIENIVFLMIVPYVTQQNKITKSLFQGTLLGGFAIFVTVTVCVLVLGPDLTARDLYPNYNVARRISVGGFFERVEAMIAILWMITLFIKATIYFYAFILGLSQLLHLKEYRALTLPTAVIGVACAPLIAPNQTYYIFVYENYWPYFVITFGLLLPLALWGVGSFRKSLGKL